MEEEEPASAATTSVVGDGGSGGGAPVVLFCHGGVWASGAAWHYAPLATRLAQAGVVTAVMQYTLFPAALAPQMAEEVRGWASVVHAEGGVISCTMRRLRYPVPTPVPHAPCRSARR